MFLKKTATDNVDKEILSLFPSLDFNRTNVHIQKKKRMKTYLVVLKKAAEIGYVTKYILTKWNASPRIGGQAAQDTLEELEGLGLVKAKQATSKKGTTRIDRILTPKGIIACMVIPEFQKAEQLKQILERQYYKGSKLASILKVFNEGFVRRIGIDESQISRAVTIVKELTVHGFNLELKSEDSIAQDLRAIEEKGFIESLKITPFEAAGALLQSLEDEDSRFLLGRLVNKYSTKEPPDFEALEKISRVLNGIFLFMSSPEGIAWIKSNKSETFTPEELIEAVDQRLLESKVKFKDDVQRFEHALKTARELIISKLWLDK